MTFEQHLVKIQNEERYSFSRWGDGEWNCLLGVNGMNCDKHNYYTDLGNRLERILASSPKYYIGLQNLAQRQRPEIIDLYTKGHNLNWSASDIFHNASIKGRLVHFFNVLRNRRVILVGGKHLKGFRDWEFIEIPQVNCWLSYEDTLAQLKETITDDCIVLFCASMMSNVLIDDLDGRCTLIDTGSVFDPYVGVKSRTYHKTLKV